MTVASENASGAANRELVTQEAGRDEPVPFEQIFQLHAPFAFRCLKRLGVPSGDVDDVCQEVFLVVHRKLDSLDPSYSVRAWIYGICIKKAKEHRRLARVRYEQFAEDLPEEQRRGGTFTARAETTIDQRRELATLDSVLDTLDEDRRAAFVLHEIEGLTLREVAAALDCPLQTAYSRVLAARKVVVASFARLGIGGPL